MSRRNPETATADLNYAFTAFKLWLLIATQVTHLNSNATGEPTNAHSKVALVWNEMYPLFQGVVQTYQAEIQQGSPSVSYSFH